MAAPATTDKRAAAIPAWLFPRREERAPEKGVVPAVLAEPVADPVLLAGAVEDTRAEVALALETEAEVTALLLLALAVLDTQIGNFFVKFSYRASVC